jgi:hypothetical protein
MIEWNIVQLDNATDESGNPTHIVTAHWEAFYSHPTAVDEYGTPIKTRRYGTVSFDNEHGSRNQPWNTITEQQVIAWVRAELQAGGRKDENELNDIEAGLVGQANKRAKNNTGRRARPW